ncbi:MAG: hydrogenase nickel incorporation protein HypB [Sedimentisphaerales bacterium]|nr:hydrogenase nickel incorporation protein HypB [Sedimentisphaerales bacterium]
MSRIKVEKNVYNRNQELAEENRRRFQQAGAYVVNMISSPGSGKTSLIERLAPRCVAAGRRLFVIEGDVETERDADRLRRLGVEAVQIQTHGACHLDAAAVARALAGAELAGVDLLIIENVGNLICPTGFDLGEQLRIVVASTAEGDDKPLKYPAAYHKADVCILNKMDLLAWVDFDVERFEAAARRANAQLQLFRTSCRTGEGIDAWCDWLMQRRA